MAIPIGQRWSRTHEPPGAALDEPAAKALLAQYGVSVPRSIVLPVGAAIEANLRGLQPPLALKVIARGVLHKSDFGGVRLNLYDATQVNAAMKAIIEAPALASHAISSFLLEEMAPAGHEMVVGGFIDRRFGPVIMTGLGGVFIEVFADVTFRVCPITADDAQAMIGELRAVAVLAGARGGAKANIDALIEVLLNIGGADGLLMDLGRELREIDINPVIVSSDGAVAVDARIILA